MIRSITIASRSCRILRARVRLASTWAQNCPEPTCDCQPTPQGLDIDHDSKMTFSPYAEHFLVCTGKDDWASKIELDTTTGPVTRHLKTLLGPPGKRGQKAIGGIVPGKYHDPYSPHMITNASFPSSTLDEASPRQSNASIKEELPTESTSVYLFPSFRYATIPAPANSEAYQASLDSLILDSVDRTNEFASGAPSEQSLNWEPLKTRTCNTPAISTQPVDEAIVLICGHGGRDSRCGALGLPLQREFEDKLARASINVLPQQRNIDEMNTTMAARVGLISHIGGHKWAGNIIIYLPPNWRAQNGNARLSASTIWYGRVEPKHVEGVVQETMLGGRIIGELLRGGMILKDNKWMQLQSAIGE